MISLLSISLYWSTVSAVAITGIALLVFTILRRRGWWWKLPFALALIVGPYALDVVRVRMSDIGESIVNATIPTSVLLSALEPDTTWPYGIVFDRLHKAPPRHALWNWQLDQLAAWCDQCIASKDNAMAKRGIQIAATVAGRGSDAAIAVLGKALMHSDVTLALLAFDSLQGMGDRVAHARAQVEEVAKKSRDPVMQARAAILLAMMKTTENPQ